MSDAERRIAKALYQIEQQLGTGQWSLHAIRHALTEDRNKEN